MGGGRWTSESYLRSSTAKAAAGYKSAFVHTEDIASGKVAAGVHELLDPKWENKNGEHAGKNIREAMDSDDHPNATPIAVLFDVTGSMGRIPGVLQAKLPQLHGLLQRKGYVEDPALMFGGIGDAYSDRAPLQVGQFEADNRGDEDLARLFLEGGGGGGCHESYELAAYFMARHTHIDSLKKRGKRGYLFFIGDERIYSTVNADQVRKLIGGVSAEQAENITTKALFDELKEKYDVYFIFAEQGSYTAAMTLDGDMPRYGADAMGWRELLGQNALSLPDADAVCELIATTLGVAEGTVTLEDGLSDLADEGADRKAIEAVGAALAKIGAGAAPVATTTGELPDADEPAKAGTERL